MSTWHYAQNDRSCGPVDLAALQELLRNRILAPGALVWKDGMANWAPANTIPELAATIPIATPPPLPSGAPSGSGIPPFGGSTPPPISAMPSGAGGPGRSDVDQNKVFAVLAYLGILFLVPLLAAPQSPFARYHTNQGVVLFISAVIVHFGSVILALATFGMGIFVAPLAWVAILVFAIMGIVHAANGECKPLPLIGHFQVIK